MFLTKTEETGPEPGEPTTSKPVTRNIPALYVRGDLIIAVSPVKKS